MQYTGTHNEVEGASQFIRSLQRQLMQFEIFERVLSLQIARVEQARLADVDGGYSGARFAQRISGSLRRTATGNQNLLMLVWPPERPYPVEQRSPTNRIVVQFTVFIEARERCRIGQPLVEFADLFQYFRPGLLALLCHVRVDVSPRPRQR